MNLISGFLKSPLSLTIRTLKGMSVLSKDEALTRPEKRRLTCVLIGKFKSREREAWFYRYITGSIAACNIDNYKGVLKALKCGPKYGDHVVFNSY